MGIVASQITSLTIVYTTVYSDADQSKHQSCASLAFVWGIGEFPAQMASYAENVFDDVIMDDREYALCHDDVMTWKRWPQY